MSTPKRTSKRVALGEHRIDRRKVRHLQDKACPAGYRNITKYMDRSASAGVLDPGGRLERALNRGGVKSAKDVILDNIEAVSDMDYVQKERLQNVIERDVVDVALSHEYAGAGLAGDDWISTLCVKLKSSVRRKVRR